MNTLGKYGIAGLGLLMASVATPAYGALINGDAADSELNQGGTTADGGGSTAQQALGNIRVGESASSGRNVELVFQLPTLSPGESFANASLEFTLTGSPGGGNGGYTIDLYGTGRRATSTTAGGDYFEGALDTTDATLIQNNVITTSTATGRIASDAGAVVALTNYLNTQYAGGAGAGQYVFLRLNPDSTTGNNNASGYQIESANSTTAANRPVINYTAVPEPATAGLAGLAVAGLLVRRKRARGGSR